MAFKLKNFTVEAFNRDVNQSGDLLAKYRDWSGYRVQVSALIGEAFARNPKTGKALVTAAGTLNDIDLRFLCSKLAMLTLSDADTDGMEQGIARQGLSDAERGKIEIHKTDYTGANGSDFFGKLETLVNREVSAAEIADYLKTAMSALADAPAQVFTERCPLVISCPVYTQLLYTQIEVFLRLLFEAGLYSHDDLNCILNAAYGAMPGILRRYNAMLLSACEPGGLLVLLSDIIEMNRDGEAYRKARQAAKDGCLDVQKAEAMTAQYGSELSIIGRGDFRLKTETLQEKYLLWPFDENKAYLVYACLANKRT
ncbi:MAG: hypothetical protein JW811_03435 [Clostridiales bacterium]|nr:hypothetical protein [Clostridiales bacterium]